MESYEIKYKDALKRAKKLYEQGTITETLSYIFPELTEPESEKIRKSIYIYLDWLDGRKDYAPRGEYTIRDMISWLEKQGEQKLAAWSEEDDINLGKAIWYVENPAPMVVKDSMLVEWLKSIKQRIIG